MAKTRDGGGAVILQFPSERREPSSIAAVARLAPSRSLVDSLLAEAGIAAHDAAAGMARELAHQLRALEAGEGSDGAIIRLRRLVDAHVLHAMDLCREYQAAGDRLISLEVQAARADRLTGRYKQLYMPRGPNCGVGRLRRVRPPMPWKGQPRRWCPTSGVLPKAACRMLPSRSSCYCSPRPVDGHCVHPMAL